MKQLHDMQTAVVTRLFALGTVLGQAMAERLADQGLTTARAEVIWRLHHHGPMNQRQLSEMLQCTPRNVTGLVDALEAAGLAERQPHPADRRATLVTLTRAGEEATNSWDQESKELGERLLDGIDTEDLIQFQATLDQILERLGMPLSESDLATSR